MLIFGGSFDPIHLGHINVLNSVQQQGNFDIIKIIPCHQSPLKAKTSASDKDRLAMLHLAFEQQSHITIDSIELNRKSPSYTIDTLIELRHHYPTTYSINLLLGIDAFSQLNQWHRWKEILSFCHLIIVNRTEMIPLTKEIQSFLDHHETKSLSTIKNTANGYCYRIDAGNYPISSTDIKAALKKQFSIEKWVPKSVAEYIKNQGLYQNA